jgi:uncharacterized protein (TIGR02147 family)
MTMRLSERLGLDRAEVAKFVPSKLVKSEQDFAQISRDRFEMISDWYHFAIMELIAVQGFKAKPKWIAATLGISFQEADAAIERLKRLGFLRVDESGKWILDSPSNSTTPHPSDLSAAHRKLQKQILSQALAAIDDVPAELRDQSSVTLSIPSSEIPRAAELIAKFRRKLARELQVKPDHDQVYQLTISLFPVTAIKKSRRTIE